MAEITGQCSETLRFTREVAHLNGWITHTPDNSLNRVLLTKQGAMPNSRDPFFIRDQTLIQINTACRGQAVHLRRTN